MGLILSTGISIGTSLLTQLACCFTSAACNSCCKSISCTNSVATRVGYSIFFLMNAILSWIMMSDTIGQKLMDWTYGYLHLYCIECVGVLAVHRVCFALACFHFMLAMLCYNVMNSTNVRASWHNGYWGPKLLAWLAILIACFFIPNEFFIGFNSYLTMIGAGIFIIIQLILLIDFAHTFSEKLVENYELSESRQSLVLLIATTLGLFSIAISITIVLYVFYGNAQVCQLNQFFISTNLILNIIALITAVSPHVQEHNPQSGLTQVSVVVAYASYLVMSAVANQPTAGTDDVCHPSLGMMSGSQTTSVVIGSIFTFIAIIYSTTTTASNGQHVILGPSQNDESVPLLTTTNVATSTQPTALQLAVESGALPSSALHQAPVPPTGRGDDNDDDVRDDEVTSVSYNYTFFHCIFGLAAMYLAMLVTSWNSVSVTNPNDGLVVVEINKSWTSVWVKICSGWVVIFLYIWTLVGPLILKDRDFS